MSFLELVGALSPLHVAHKFSSIHVFLSRSYATWTHFEAARHYVRDNHDASRKESSRHEFFLCFSRFIVSWREVYHLRE